MKRLQRRNPALGVLIAATTIATLTTLSGCNSLSSMLASDKVNYEGATSAPPLQVPKDLSAPKIDANYVAPPVEKLGNAPKMTITDEGSKTIGLPSPRDPLGMHVEADRDQRWLIIDGRSPEELWPELRAFWAANGFVVQTDSPETGVMETDWAENRAKIPQDWFRRTFGRLVDAAYSSGTRDKFRTQLERTADGSTAIFITHRGMQEEEVGRYQDTTRWVDRPRDPNLEIAFMGRLMEKFGLTNGQAKQLITQARPAAERVARLDESNGIPTIIVNEPLERAWLRVSLALDRSNFQIDDSDRAQSVFTVRYSDPVRDSEHRSGLFGKLFNGKSDPSRRPAYRVSLRSNANGATQISVIDIQGQTDRSAQARQLLTILQAQLS